MEPSRSKRKLADIKYDIGTGASPGFGGYRLVDVELLADFLASHLVCEKCHGRIQVTEAAVKKKDEVRVRVMEIKQRPSVKRRRYALKKMRKTKQHAAVAIYPGSKFLPKTLQEVVRTWQVLEGVAFLPRS